MEKPNKPIITTTKMLFTVLLLMFKDRLYSTNATNVAKGKYFLSLFLRKRDLSIPILPMAHIGNCLMI